MLYFQRYVLTKPDPPIEVVMEAADTLDFLRPTGARRLPSYFDAQVSQPASH